MSNGQGSRALKMSPQLATCQLPFGKTRLLRLWVSQIISSASSSQPALPELELWWFDIVSPAKRGKYCIKNNTWISVWASPSISVLKSSILAWDVIVFILRCSIGNIYSAIDTTKLYQGTHPNTLQDGSCTCSKSHAAHWMVAVPRQSKSHCSSPSSRGCLGWKEWTP